MKWFFIFLFTPVILASTPESPILTYSEAPSEQPTFRVAYLKHIKTSHLLPMLSAICDHCQWSVDHANQSVGVRSTPSQWQQLVTAIRKVDKPIAQVQLNIDIIEITNTYSDRYQNIFSHLTEPIIQNQQIDNYIQMMISSGNASILSSPSIKGVSGQKIQLNVGEKIPYLEPVHRNGYQSHQLQYIDSGISVSITPYVHYSGNIDMTIELNYNTVNGYRSELGEDLPIFATRTSILNVQVKNKDTLMFAGLIDESDHQTLEKVPILGDLPVFGFLFRKELTKKQKTDLIYRITPTRL